MKLTYLKKRPGSLILWILLRLAAVITAFALGVIIIYILAKGIPNLKPSLFSLTYTTENASMLPAIINTCYMVLLTLIVAVPLGLGAAIYLTEYAKRGNKLVKIVRVTAETLAGIPSIVYGLFGYLCFVVTFRWGYAFLAGSLTLAIMVLPTILRTAEEAIKAVPDSYREGSFGLGAGRLRTVIRVVLPSALPGILSGIILAVGRIVGETAALLFTAGTLPQVPGNLLTSGRTLAIHLYALWSEGLYTSEAYATAAVLLVLVACINLGATALVKRLGTEHSTQE